MIRTPCLYLTRLRANPFPFIFKDIFILIRFTLERLSSGDLSDTARGNSSDDLIAPRDCSIVELSLYILSEENKSRKQENKTPVNNAL